MNPFPSDHSIVTNSCNGFPRVSSWNTQQALRTSKVAIQFRDGKKKMRGYETDKSSFIRFNKVYQVIEEKETNNRPDVWVLQEAELELILQCSVLDRDV